MIKQFLPPAKQKFYYLNCECGLLSGLLSNFDITISDMLGQDFVFYAYINENGIPTVERRLRSYYDQLKADYGFEIQESNFPDLTSAREYLTTGNERKSVNILAIDCYYFPLIPLYQQDHRIHYISVVDYSLEDQTYTIFDPTYSLYNVKVPWNVIEEGWSAKNFKYVDIVINQSAQILNFADFVGTMKNNVKHMFEPQTDQVYINKEYINLKGKKCFYAGLEGLQSFGASIKELLKSTELDKKLHNTFFQVSYLGEHTELHGFYLQSIALKYGIQELLKLSDDVNYIAQSWSVVANMLLKASIKEPEQMVERCVNKIHAIVKLELDYLNSLNTLLRRL